MRWLVIDELLPGDSIRLAERLDAMELGSGITGLNWLPLPESLLSAIQQEHTASCGPHVMALEVEDTLVRLELLVRARARLRCDCLHYASPALVAHMADYLSQLLAELQIAG